MASEKSKWKKSFRKIPKRISEKIRASTSEFFIVVGTKTVSKDDIVNGVYAQVGLSIGSDGKIQISPMSYPDPESGRFAKWNVHGRTVKRSDLPKIEKTFSWETPNFGDGATYGYHTSCRVREVYQVEEMEPRFLEVSCEVLRAPQDENGDYLLKFQISQPVDKGMESFEREILFYINVLQESCGVSDVFDSGSTREDFMGTVSLDWEIFPPGSSDEIRAKLMSSRNQPNSAQLEDMLDRMELFSRLRPVAYLRGTGGFGSYIGAQYADDLVVFENVRYGNALYVLYEDWSSVAQRSRLELIRGTSKNYDRFAHIDGWEDRLIDHLARELKKRGHKNSGSFFDAA